MRNVELHINLALNRYYEAESMMTLIQKWAETYKDGKEGDQTLKNGFTLLEDAMNEVFRAICRCKDECTDAKIAKIEHQRLAKAGGSDE